MSAVRLVVVIETLPGRRAEQIAVFSALAPVVRAEEGCLQYDMFEVADEPERFVILERWASSAALEAHDVAPHILAADAANKTFRAGPATVLITPDAPVA